MNFHAQLVCTRLDGQPGIAREDGVRVTNTQGNNGHFGGHGQFDHTGFAFLQATVGTALAFGEGYQGCVAFGEPLETFLESLELRTAVLAINQNVVAL